MTPTTRLEQFKHMVDGLTEEDLHTDLLTTWMLQWVYYVKGILDTMPAIKPPTKPPQTTK